MPEFNYRARTDQGRVITGTVDADNQRLATIKLRRQNLTVISIEQIKGKGFPISIPGLGFFRRVSINDLAIFSRQLSTLINSGIPIVQSLNILAAQTEKKIFKDVIHDVRREIEAGSSIGEAFAKHPKVFSDFYVSMLKSGETGGVLDAVLLRLAAYLEELAALKRKVRSALFYPSIILGVAITVVTFMIIFIIPVFKEMFAGFEAELPLPTQILIAISDYIRANILFAIIFLIAGLFLISRAIKTEKGKYLFDVLILKIPIFGKIIRKLVIARFARTLSSLVGSGVPILEAMSVVTKTVGNKIIENAILKARDSIREGERISDPLQRSKVFPPMVTQMIAVGEESGTLDSMLEKVAEFYDQEASSALASATSLIEPILIIVLGVTVGGILICLYYPIFTMATIIK
jgi:type IV pilus assembly protein PilC